LAENFNNQPTVKKELTKKRVVFGVETDLSGTSGDLFTQPSLYNEYKEVIDFVAVRGSKQATYVSPTTAKLTNVRKPLLPSELSGVFDVVNWFRIYINGDFISPNLFNYTYNGQLKEILFDFSALTFTIDENDEILITGKFQEL
jgi:hypothetical protein